MNAESISLNNRRRKYDLFTQQLQPAPDSEILDVGFSNEEYLSGDNYLEKHYPYPHQITALGIAESDMFQKRYPQVAVVRYGGKTFPFPNKHFDIGWSNAVIEHVGREDAQVLFLKELHRTCHKVYFTTPNRYFPFELHTRILLLH
jgi:SAM-dependent methyltransferase